MKILITGADGYIGWPLTINLLKKTKHKIIAVDNLLRRKWVKEVNAESAIKIASIGMKKKFIKKFNSQNDFISFDLMNFKNIDKLISKHKFDKIINLAAQPSAPYSFINVHKCNYSQNNNNQILRNLIWSIKNNKLEKKTKLIHTTTTGVYGSPNFKIPEGFLVKSRQKYPFGFMAGSWYHMSKCNDINSLYLAKKTMGIDCIDFRTAITVGLNYEGFEKTNDNIYNTRFDYDYNFGVVLNRFIAMAIRKKPLTIYGKGLQEKPFVSLYDCVESLSNVINFNTKIDVVNQYSAISSIKEVGNIISKNKLILDSKVTHIKNPRVENEKHKMKMDNLNFLKILNRKPQKMKNIIDETIKILIESNAKFKKKFN